jgi:hypothetical protein
MASQPSRTNPTSNPMGNSIPCLVSGKPKVAGSRLIFCNLSELGHSYLLHDHAANFVLVRVYKLGERVGARLRKSCAGKTLP